MTYTMFRKLPSLSLALASASLVALVSATSWAVPTICVTVGTGPVALKLAIASNFFGPAQDMASAYLSATGGTRSALVCHNSTGHLQAEIVSGTELPPELGPTDPGFPRYDYFFAANTATPVSLQASTGHTAFLYAKGVPVLYSESAFNPQVTSVGDLITGLGPATHATIAGTQIGGLQINSRALSVGVANPTGAPYGQAAKNVTTAMGYTWNGNTPPSPPVHPTLFSNIDITFSSVGTTVNNTFVGAAFVAKSQICPSLQTARYVEFPGFSLDQSAIQLSTNTESNGFDSYLHGRLSTDWDAFLTLNCYGALRAGAAVPLGPVAPLAGGLLLLGALAVARRKSRAESAA
jgi:hypothetical protein